MNSLAAETSELHREMIADHTARPRNAREMRDATHQAEGHNRLCGDRVTVWVKVVDDTIADISFNGSGCSIGTSSASIMTESLAGKSIKETMTWIDRFQTLLTTDAEMDPDQLGKLAVFAGVKRFPVRVKCATLPWHTLRAALAQPRPI